GNATFSTSLLSVGSHRLTVTYAGNANFAASVSPSLVQDVAQASTQILTTLATSFSGLGQPVTINATVQVITPGAGAPTGTVTFRDGSSIIGSASLVGGMASLTTVSLGVGTHAISASYSGDPSFVGGASISVPLTINLGTTTTSVVSSGPTVFGQPTVFTAFVSTDVQGIGAPTGSVTFRDGSNVLGTVALSGTVAQFTTSALSSGEHSIVATYVGDSNLSGSTATGAQSVAPASTSTMLVSTAGTVAYGQTVTFTASVAVTLPGVGAPT